MCSDQKQCYELSEECDHSVDCRDASEELLCSNMYEVKYSKLSLSLSVSASPFLFAERKICKDEMKITCLQILPD